MDSQCIDLAAVLSSRYRNTDPFDNKSPQSLPLYLSTHGLLLTMCFPWECTLTLQDTHISGSWINQRVGPQVIQGPDVGVILDPLKADINCVYPTDGATMERDNAGCGPYLLDPDYGSAGNASYNWLTRRLARKQLTSYKTMNFGVDTPWEDIACEFFFPFTGPIESNALSWHVDDEGEIQYKRLLSVLQDETAAIMGHPVCTCPKDEDSRSLWPFFIFFGRNGWDPSEWQTVMDMQHSFIEPETSDHMALWWWNEIVMSLPSIEYKDMILSVFYLDLPDDDAATKEKHRQHATRVAKMYGDKPVMALHVDAKPEDDLLKCLDTTPVTRTEFGIPASTSSLMKNEDYIRRDQSLLAGSKGNLANRKKIGGLLRQRQAGTTLL